MAFFLLIPFYWLASVLIYAASPRQLIKPVESKVYKKGIVTKQLAWLSYAVINMVSFGWLLLNQWAIVVIFINLLLINMLLVPCSVIFLAHKPHWLKLSSCTLIVVCFIAQWVIEGQVYVA